MTHWGFFSIFLSKGQDEQGFVPRRWLLTLPPSTCRWARNRREEARREACEVAVFLWDSVKLLRTLGLGGLSTPCPPTVFQSSPTLCSPPSSLPLICTHLGLLHAKRRRRKGSLLRVGGGSSNHLRQKPRAQ